MQWSVKDFMVEHCRVWLSMFEFGEVHLHMLWDVSAYQCEHKLKSKKWESRNEAIKKQKGLVPLVIYDVGSHGVHL